MNLDPVNERDYDVIIEGGDYRILIKGVKGTVLYQGDPVKTIIHNGDELIGLCENGIKYHKRDIAEHIEWRKRIEERKKNPKDIAGFLKEVTEISRKYGLVLEAEYDFDVKPHVWGLEEHYYSDDISEDLQ